MKTMTATSASRGFSEVLDRVESGETIRITRDGHLVAELRPITPATGRALRAALAAIPPLDADLSDDIASVTSLITDEVNGSWPAN